MLKDKIKGLEGVNDQKIAEIARLNQKFSEYRVQGSQQAQEITSLQGKILALERT